MVKFGEDMFRIILRLLLIITAGCFTPFNHYLCTTQNSRTSSLCNLAESYVQCPLLIAVLFLYVKKGCDSPLKACRMFAQATSHKMLDGVTRC